MVQLLSLAASLYRKTITAPDLLHTLGGNDIMDKTRVFQNLQNANLTYSSSPTPCYQVRPDPICIQRNDFEVHPTANVLHLFAAG